MEICTRPVQLSIRGEVYHAHPAAAEFVIDLKRADACEVH